MHREALESHGAVRVISAIARLASFGALEEERMHSCIARQSATLMHLYVSMTQS